MNELTIYLKLTNQCQLRCQHCYNSLSQFSGDMSESTLSKSIEFIKKKKKDNTIKLIFHGGEPIFSGTQQIERVIKEIKDVDYYITTNLMYEINNQILDIFRRCKIVSTSWDYKVRFQNTNQENLWLKNICYLLNNDIIVSPIISLNKYLVEELNPADLLNKFLELGVKQLNFERLTNTGNALKYSLKPDNYQIDKWLFSAYKKYEKTNLIIPLFESIEKSVYNNILIGCRKRRCQEEVITINPDGTITGCPNTYQNIYGDVLGNFNKNCFNSLICKEKFKNNNCYICPLYTYCNGDCHQLSWDETGCPGLKSIIEYILLKFKD